MPDTESILSAELPRRFRGLGIPFAAVALTSFFILIGFPYHHVTNRAAAAAAASMGVEIAAEDSGFTIGLDGLGFRFNNIDVETATGDTYALDMMRFGPAWSLSWFMLEPKIFFEVDAAFGGAQGKVGTGDSPSLEVSVRDAVLADLRFLDQTLPMKLTGTINAEASIETVEEGFVGPITFDLVDGEFGDRDMPVQVAYDTVQGSIHLGGDHLVRIEAFDLKGPMFNAQAKGHVSKGATPAERTIDLDVSFDNILAPLRPTLEGVGAKVAQDGTGELRVGGTIGAPAVK